MKKLLLFLIVLNYLPTFSQVGIGTTNPNAKLDIKSTSLTAPTNTDGVLIPKMNNFPATNPTIVQDGMLVFITGNGTPSKGFYYWNQPTLTWIPLGGNSGVKKIDDLLDGKSDPNGSSVFLGTQAGLNDDGTSNANVGVGLHNLRANTIGVYNTGVGNRSLFNNTIGNYNTGLGGNALFSNTTGNQNTAIGINALYQNSTGIHNVAAGVNALRYSTIGSYNVADGSRSLFSLTVGNRNTVSGFEAMFNATAAYRNTASGFRTLYNNTTGTYNTAFGYESGYNNTNGVFNVFLGYQAGYFSNGSNKLFIENRNANANNALIYGEFGADATRTGNILRTNSQFQIGNPTLTGYAFPTIDGAANQVLKTNGNGGLNWTNANTLGTDNQNLTGATLIGTTLQINIENGTSTAINLAGLQDGGAKKINDLLDGKSDPNGSSVFLGTQAGLNDNGTSNANVGVGFQSLKSNTYGGNNTANGYQSMFSNTGGYLNTANGYQSLYRNIAGIGNTSNGYRSLFSNTTGHYNTANGYQSLYTNTIGTYNTANGLQSLYHNTIGSRNSALGDFSLYTNTTGYHNTSVGSNSLFKNITGSVNTAIGIFSLYYNKSGNYNTGVGYFNGYPNPNVWWLTNSTALGSITFNTASNQVRIGSNTVTSIGGFRAWTNLSDGRFKKNVKENVKGLDFILKLRPVTYNLDVKKIDAFLKVPDSISNGKNGELIKFKKQAEKEVQSGFIAQEVEQAAKELGYDFSGVDKPKNENDYYGLRYAEFVVPLVKGMQEQQRIIKTQQKEISQLKQVLLKQKEQLNKIELLLNKTSN